MIGQTKLIYYIAASLDGFIATPDGAVDWLAPYQQLDYGTDAFMAGVDTVLLGRATYDQAMREWGWAYPGKRGLVLTNRPVADAPDGVEACAPDIAAVAARLAAWDSRAAWLLGGGRAAQPFIAADLVDQYEIFVMPILLGDGIRLFSGLPAPRTRQLADQTVYPNGVMRLVYS